MNMMSNTTESNVKVAIVTTCKGGGETTVSWMAYHLEAGFDHLFMFFDDPNDPALVDARKFDKNQVSIIVSNEEVKEKLKGGNAYKHMEQYLNDEVQARQQVNAELALQLSTERGYHWLLHIDVDEIFYSFNKPVKQHFKELMEQNIGHLTYMNYEAVPTKVDIGDYFQEVTLFRRHLSSVQLTAPAYQALEYWTSRRRHGQFFLAYDNGKSAVRVMPGVTPSSVHEWKLPKQSTEAEHLKSCTAINDARHLDLNKLHKCDDVVILHFVVCGWKWYLSKYKILDVFPNHWFGGKLKIAPCFHLDSRDKYLEGDLEKMKQFYIDQVVLDEAQVEKQIGAGLCVRIDNVLKTLEKVRDKYPMASAASVLHLEDLTKEKRGPVKAVDGPPSTVNTLPLTKQWMIAALVGQYLNPDDKQ